MVTNQPGEVCVCSATNCLLDRNELEPRALNPNRFAPALFYPHEFQFVTDLSLRHGHRPWDSDIGLALVHERANGQYGMPAESVHGRARRGQGFPCAAQKANRYLEVAPPGLPDMLPNSSARIKLRVLALC
jgi:hypothetical protein